MSGHVFFADKWYGFDDALYAAIRLLGIVARMPGKVSAVREALPHVVNTPELRFDCDDVRKFQVITEVAARLKTSGADVSDIDGVRVNTPDGWWLLRASNTQAVLVARAEAKDEPGLERLKARPGGTTHRLRLAARTSRGKMRPLIGQRRSIHADHACPAQPRLPAWVGNDPVAPRPRKSRAAANDRAGGRALPRTNNRGRRRRMARAYNCIDSDGHILEPLDLWQHYMDPKYRDHARARSRTTRVSNAW